ncbi:MAG: DUF968 domain-containing protein [Usitatibacter sp.]
MSLFKDTRYENPRLLREAGAASCVMCGANDGTVVAAHSNQGEHGKGKGLKAHDIYVAYLCHRCHAYVDHQLRNDPTGVWGDTQAERVEFFNKAMHKTWLLWARRGWIKPSV